MAIEPAVLRADADTSPSDAEIARIAVTVLDAIPFPALVLEVPSERIVASSRAGARLLEPDGAAVDGHLLQEFTTDRPAAGRDLHAGARLDGAETLRILRRSGGDDLHVRLWIRSFEHQPTSNFVVAVIVADDLPGRDAAEQTVDGADSETDRPDAPAVVGLVDSSLLIERISSDAEALFEVPAADLLHRSLLSTVAQVDVARCLLAFGESSASRNGITLHVHIVAGGGNLVPCELLLLPLQPAPSCIFVLLPVSEGEMDGLDRGDFAGILLRLRRGAEIAHIAHGAFSSVSEHARPGLSRLTTREFEVVTRLLDGQRPPAIARALFLSQSTVRNHLGSVFAKYGVTSQQQLLDLLRSA
jgi:DNA-binding CsgD family transcriptional regulator